MRRHARPHRWIAWSAALCWIVAWPMHASMRLAQALGGVTVVCTESGARLVHTGDAPQAPQTGGSPSCPVCAQLTAAAAPSAPTSAGPALVLAACERAMPRHAARALPAAPRVGDWARAPPAA
jgi:hypothetical protein